MASQAPIGLKQITTAVSTLGDLRSFAHIGDSRTAAIHEGFASNGYKTQRHWFNVANALNGQNMKIAGNYGISGNRSDQFLATNLASALASNSGWLVFGSPAVNDISQASATPFTNVNGVSVTVSNVALVAFNNITSAAYQALQLGKRVIICSETGATGLNTTQVTAVFEINQRLREFCENTPNCFFFDFTSIVWNSTSSSSSLAFKTGYSSDGTHWANLGGYFVGKAFASFITRFVPPVNQACSNIADVNSTNPMALMVNPLFNTLTGGSSSGGVVISSGNIPANITISAAATTSVAITSGLELNGIGNTVTLNITGTAADTLTFTFLSPAASSWSLTDVFQGGIHVDVAAGSSNASIYWGNQLNTEKGTLEMYDMYSSRTGTNYGPGPSEAYSYDFASVPSSVISGSTTKGYVGSKVTVLLHAAGNITLTLSRNWLRKRFSLLS